MATLTSNQPNSEHSLSYSPTRRARYSDNVYFQDGHIVTAILAVLLYMLAAVSLDAAGYADNMSILVPVTMGAAILGLLISFSRFDGFFALSLSLFTGFAWILFLMSRQVTPTDIQPFVGNGISPPQARAYFVLLQWVNWVESAMRSQAAEDNFIFVFEISLLVWWLTFLGIWSIFRFGYTWRAIIPAGVVLAINAFFAPNPVVPFLIVFSFVALVLLVRTNLAEQQLRWRDHRVRFSPDVVFDFVRSALYLSAIVLALAWIVPSWIAPSLGSSPQVRQFTRPVRSALDKVGEQLNELYPSVNRQQVGTSSFGSSLTLSGARNVGDRPVFQVESQVGRYWRAVTFDFYDGRTWKNTTKERAKFDADELIPIANWGDRETITQTVTLLMPTGNVIFSPPDLRQVDTPINALVRPLPAAPLPNATGEESALEVTYALSSRKLEAFDSYTVVSNYVSPTERDLRNASEEYPPQILERYLQLPDDFSPRVAQTAQDVVAGKTTVYDKAKAVETYLRGITYNDAIPAPPKDQDPIEWFLYDIKQGYCDYYATSMAIMLRSLGIPARTASGYAEGTYSEEDGVFYITERDAHTWVEVYFPGVGWVEFEPTAGESVLTRQSGEDALAANAATGSESPDNPSLAQGENQASESNADAGVDNIPEDASLAGGEEATANRWRRWLWIALTIFMFLVGLLALWRVRFADSAPLDFTPDAAPILYERMVRWAERIGVLFGRGQTPYEQSDVLSRSLPAGKPYIQEITDEYVYYRFSGRMQPADGGADDGRRVETFQARTIESWKALRAIFMKEWLRQKTRRKKRRKKDAYTLE